jgi:DNA-binding transcriptional MerR regulator
MTTHTIGALSEEFGTTLRALRFYEERGLVAPTRKGRWRVYSEADRVRIAEIMRLRALGFTIREIKSGRFPREKFAEQLNVARRQRAELDQVIVALEKIARAA